MNIKLHRVVTLFAALAIIMFGMTAGRTALAGEHPEHPKQGAKGSGADHEHAPVTKEDMAKAISTYVEKDAKLKGGYFLVFDSESNQPLALKLERVHKERLSHIGKDSYFACADFRTHDGKKVFDLDVFMRGHDKDHLAVTEVSVHKEDGKERYGWMEKDGAWMKKPVEKMKGSDEKKKEHPAEHPKEKGRKGN